MVLTLDRSYALDKGTAQRAPEQVVRDTYNQFSAGHYLGMYNGDEYIELRREIMDSTKKAQKFQDAYGKPPQILRRFSSTYDKLATRYNQALEIGDEDKMKKLAKLSDRFKERQLERMQLEEAA